jgi:thiamine-phosphate pyrophosphorylase
MLRQTSNGSPNPLILPPLYFVTDHHMTGGRSQIEIIEAAFRGGVQLLQYRDKELSESDFRAEGREVVALARRYGAMVLFNDRVEAAAELKADGVHLGQDDLPATEARRLLGEKAIIGLSTHNEAEVAAAGVPEIAAAISYINIGPMFPTATKDHSAHPALGLHEVLRLSRLTQHPFTTMGGIKAHHLPELFASGIKTVAMVTEISLAPDPAQRVRELLGMMGPIV